jgi:hypothetical protein
VQSAKKLSMMINDSVFMTNYNYFCAGIFIGLNQMQFKLLLFLSCFNFLALSAQTSPTEIKYTCMDIRALRYYPFQTDAQATIREMIEEKLREIPGKPYFQYDIYRKTSIDLLANKEYLDLQINAKEEDNDWIYNRIIKPYLPWLEYARPQKEDSKHVALTTMLDEDYFTCYSDNPDKQSGRLLQASKSAGLYRFVGEQNIRRIINDILGDIDLYQKKNDVLARTLQGPLSEDAMLTYCYFLSGKKTENGETWHEIVFYPRYPSSAGFAGYLYVSADGQNTLRKAVFSVNNLSNSNTFIEDIVFIQYFETKENILVPVEKRNYYVLGDDVKGCFLLTQSSHCFNFSYPEYLGKEVLKTRTEKDYSTQTESFWENRRPEPLTASERQAESLTEIASRTKAFRNTENFVYLLLSDHFPVGGKNGFFEWGNVTQVMTYNEREGFRFKAGGNTTSRLSKHFLFGGYLAYGLKDKQFKYRGDILYSFLPKEKSVWEYPLSLLSFTYINDLNIPGENLLTSNRDDIFHAFSYSADKPLTWQKTGILSFEQEMANRFSFKVQGKYLSDKPVNENLYKNYTTSEILFALRYAPNEKTFQRREKRMYFKRGDIELNLCHRTGLKGIFGSEYNYQITDGNIFKRLYFPKNIGDVDMELSAGKVWSRIPFPLLFIPQGNQSYILEMNGFNLLNFNEFVTDNFVAGNINFRFNWSPVELFWRKSKIKSNLGGRIIYGPLSDNNNPALHAELFPFSPGIQALGGKPYMEVNAGFSNIFNLIRIEYVRRLSYMETGNEIKKGSLFVTIDLRF